MVTPVYQRPLDTTGVAASNKITGERHSITPPENGDRYFIVPKKAPFFGSSLVITHIDSGYVLVEGVDYHPTFRLIWGSTATDTDIHRAISILNTGLSGIFNLDYQTLGGPWAVDEAQIAKDLARTFYNKRVSNWSAIQGAPLYYRPLTHQQSIADIAGMSPLIAKISEIQTAIEQKNANDKTAFWDYFESQQMLHEAGFWYQKPSTSDAANPIPALDKDIDTTSAGAVYALSSDYRVYVKVSPSADFAQASEYDAMYDAGYRANSLVVGYDAAASEIVVLVGDDGFLAIFNGSVITPVTTEHLNRVRYVNGMFIAVGNNGVILTSTDGSSWAVATTNSSVAFEDVGYGNNIYIAVGAGEIYESTDAVTWTPVADQPLLDPAKTSTVVFGHGKFVIINDNIVYSTDDASIWKSTLLMDQIHRITFGYRNANAGIFVAVGKKSIYGSIDGIRWGYLRSPNNDTDMMTVAYTGESFMIGSIESNVYYSSVYAF